MALQAGIECGKVSFPFNVGGQEDSNTRPLPSSSTGRP